MCGNRTLNTPRLNTCHEKSRNTDETCQALDLNALVAVLKLIPLLTAATSQLHMHPRFREVVSIPQQSWGLYVVSRSKWLERSR